MGSRRQGKMQARIVSGSDNTLGQDVQMLQIKAVLKVQHRCGC